MEQVKDAFERCATQITNASDGSVEVQVRPFDIIDQPTWETLRSGGSAGKTWFFWANFRQGGERIQYYFFFGRHWFSEADREFSQIGPGANLLISEQKGDGPAVRLSDVPNCPIALREILVIDNKLARKRVDTATNKEVYDHDVDALQTAREFVEQVFFSRLS